MSCTWASRYRCLRDLHCRRQAKYVNSKTLRIYVVGDLVRGQNDLFIYRSAAANATRNRLTAVSGQRRSISGMRVRTASFTG